MNDRTPTEATWKLVPAEPTPEMIAAGAEANPTEWNEGTDFIFPSDVAESVYRAMLAASPPAPAAEAVAYRWRYLYSDGRAYGWAYQAAPLNIPAEGDACSELETPAIISEPLYTHPLDAAAIRAEARREALEEAAAYHDEEADSYHKLYLGYIRARNEEKAERCQERVQWHRAHAGAIRALADKGEAE